MVSSIKYQVLVNDFSNKTFSNESKFYFFDVVLNLFNILYFITDRQTGQTGQTNLETGKDFKNRLVHFHLKKLSQK